MKIIELKNIIKNIGKKKLFQLDYLEVNTNEIIGIIGGNGVGNQSGYRSKCRDQDRLSSKRRIEESGISQQDRN